MADIAALPAKNVAAAAEAAVRAIPPVFPLSATVAVNPYLGQTGERLAVTGARLARVAGIPVTPPRKVHLAKIEAGEITDADLEAALAAQPSAPKPADVAALKLAAAAPEPAPEAAPTVADLAAEAAGIDFPGLIAERFGHWAAGWCDRGQALWAAPKGKGAYAAWRATATHDLTPEIAGVDGFAAHVAEAPETAAEAMARAVERLGLPKAALETYFHELLMTLGGWSQVARHGLWEAELEGGADTSAVEFLAIRLLWEEALFALHGEAIAAKWEAAKALHASPVEPTPALVVDEILQEAAERAAQRELAELFAAPAPAAPEGRPALQAAFCIDVRSEVFRRALEAVDPSIRTLGFAGFFGLTAAHRGFASDVVEKRLPVLLTPGVTTVSDAPEATDREARFAARALRAWGRFKLAAVSSFAFVEATGPIYAAKLVRDALGLEAKALPEEPAPRLDPALDLETRIGAAETVLRAMSLTEGFARLVLLAGHGANVTNNPHASALHCGACGGYSGEVNARLLAALLNDPEVRAGLAPKGIEIPEDTLFLGALHDTTTDAVKVYAGDHDVSAHREDLRRAEGWLAAAGKVTRAERALRLPRAAREADVPERARDWAELRPEWALAGCKAFVAAPRSRSAGRSLEGRAFLHDYEWRKDEANGYPVLELILTAPVVVASWISLQYYGSTVSPTVFGGGDKLLHNVVGGIGVVEGNGGLLRPGLPWQSVHDGERLQHEPLRLSVCVEAPTEAILDVLRKHDGVRDLFDNGWLHLFAMDAAGRMAWRYRPGLAFEAVEDGEALRAAG